MLRPVGREWEPYLWKDLFDAWATSRLKLEKAPNAGLPATLIEDMRRDISSFSEEQQREARRRLGYVQALDLAIQERRTERRAKSDVSATEKPKRVNLKPETLDAFAKRYFERSGAEAGEKAPNGSSLRSWYRRYVRSGKMLSALIPQWHRRGWFNTTSRVRLCEIASAVMTEYLHVHWLTQEQPSALSIFRLATAEIKKRGGTVPDQQAWYRLIRSTDARIIARYREGKRDADRAFDLRGNGPDWFMPGQAVQIDSTKLPVVVRDYTDELKFKQVTMTVAIDVATRAILGFYVGLEEGFVTIQETLRMMMLPKIWTSQFDNVKNTWSCTLKPAIIFTDQGSDYRCGSMKLLCAQLNIQLIHTPAGAPEMKGHVERVIQTIKKKIFGGMPGSLFKTGLRRIDYDAAARAELTMEQVLWFVVKFISDYYMPGWHEGIEDTPQNRWNELVDRYDVDLAPDLNHLIPLISEQCRSKLTRNGFTWKNLHYGASSEVLQRMFNAKNKDDVEYVLKIDPLDVGQAWFLHPEGHWVALQCNSPGARGRTKHEHLVARANVRLRKKTYELSEMSDIDEAYAEIKDPQIRANQRRFDSVQARQKARVRTKRLDPLASLKDTLVQNKDSSFSVEEEIVNPTKVEPSISRVLRKKKTGSGTKVSVPHNSRAKPMSVANSHKERTVPERLDAIKCLETNVSIPSKVEGPILAGIPKSILSGRPTAEIDDPQTRVSPSLEKNGFEYVDF
ncbi:transposase family protein [Methylobacterium sp.]|uniref:integrase catalytic domain-containing protein n=1 Tax=Methylobacterium sp. TaxID=409 RepID=UPI0025E4FA5A|nr:transposase family protein [Methylobacterium sp.]MBY0257513.1 DDE-type integrase/transposase/recombinase [Methylobacterium sp.]